MLGKNILTSLAAASLALTVYAAPQVGRPNHSNRPNNPINRPNNPINRPNNPGNHAGNHPGGYHSNYRGHHHFHQPYWVPRFGHANPGGYKCVATDYQGGWFEGWGWNAGENALDACYRNSWNRDECHIDAGGCY